MAQAKLERFGNIFVNVAVVVTCVIVSVSALKNLSEYSAPTTPGSSPGYAVDDVLPPIADVQFTNKPWTLLLVVASTCRYCTESMPLYLRLSQQRQASGLQVVAVGHEPAPVLTKYLSQHLVNVDSVVSIAPGALNVQGTPTMILVDSQRKVLGVWRGALRERERDVEREIGLAVRGGKLE